jgi:hypothetical protein
MEIFSLELKLFLVKEEKNGEDEPFVVEDSDDENVDSHPDVGVVCVDEPLLVELRAFDVVTHVV